jgi:hypothetical protein
MDRLDNIPLEPWQSDIDWQGQQVAEMIVDASEIEKHIQYLQLAEYSQNQPNPPKTQKPKTLKTPGQNKRKKRRGRHKKNNY